MAVTMARRVFPADVETPDGIVHREVLAVVTSQDLTVYTERGAGPFRELLTLVNAALSVPGSVEPSKNTLAGSAAVIAATDHGQFRITRSSGCGCAKTLLKQMPDPCSWTGR